MRPGVTVILPVYGDPVSLSACLDSVLAHVDLSVDALLVVNDGGPDADIVEQLVVERLGNRSGARYERNSRNLGFVETANRAALELDDTENDLLFLNSDTIISEGLIDELSAVLHSSPTHATVCPRSNNATIASFPYTMRHPMSRRSASRSRLVHARLRDELPRFSVTPVSMGFCFLVRRQLVREHGLFDPRFSPGYAEENDFCLRMNALGYSSLIAHRVLVAHVGAQSFTGRRGRALRARHERLLVARHRFYPRAVMTYLQRDMDPIDRFADALIADEEPARLLVDTESWRDDQQVISGIAHAAAAGSRSDGSLVTVATDRFDVSRMRRRYPGIAAHRRDRDDGLFDIAAIRTVRTSASQLIWLNQVALRWVAIVEDPSDIRRWRWRVRNPVAHTLARETLRHATAIVYIGSDTEARAAALFGSVVGTGVPTTVVPDRDPESMLGALGSFRDVVVSYDRLRARDDAFSALGAHLRAGRLRSTPLRIRIARQAEWLAPSALDLARKILRRS